MDEETWLEDKLCILLYRYSISLLLFIFLLFKLVKEMESETAAVSLVVLSFL